MRLSWIVFCLLIVLSLGGLTAAAIEINSVSDQVTYERSVLWGDPSFAEGAEVENFIHYDRHLHWNILVDAAGTAKTEYDFTAQEKNGYIYDSRERGVTLNGSFNYGMAVNVDAEEQTGISAVYKRLYDRTPVGEEGRELIRIADYYTYYPVAGEIDLPDFFIHWDSDEIVRSSTVYNFPLEKITEFFRIPVLPNEYTEIHLKREAHGYSWGSGYVTDENSAYDSFFFSTSSVVTEDACYIVFSNLSAKGRTVDTSQVPGGYGIYCLPFERDGKGKTTVHADDLGLWYALSEDIHVISLYKDDANRYLILFASENGYNTMTVLDIEEKKEIQKEILWRNEEYDLRDVVVEDEYILLRQGGDLIQLWEENENGTLTQKIHCRTVPSEDEQLTRKLYYNFFSVRSAWDGKRLLIMEYTDDNYYTQADFILAVYTADGLMYGGEYKCSLSTEYRSNTSSYYCTPEKKASVRWK